MHSQTDQIRITEEGEAIGTLRQFSSSFDMSHGSVLECMRREAEDSIILHAGSGRDRVLIVDAQAIEALLDCTTPDQDRTSASASAPRARA